MVVFPPRGGSMRTVRITFLILVITLLAVALPRARAQPTTSRQTTSTGAGTQSSPSASVPVPSQATVPLPRVTAYTLPPDLYKKARDRSRIEFCLALISFFYGLTVLWVILHWRASSAYTNWAERSSTRRIIQAVVFAPLILLTI